MKWDLIEQARKEVERLPPCGGSGLKLFSHVLFQFRRLSPSMRREWIEIPTHRRGWNSHGSSPSMRREWIEIGFADGVLDGIKVSLHAEGVD